MRTRGTTTTKVSFTILQDENLCVSHVKSKKSGTGMKIKSSLPPSIKPKRKVLSVLTQSQLNFRPIISAKLNVLKSKQSGVDVVQELFHNFTISPPVETTMDAVEPELDWIEEDMASWRRCQDHEECMLHKEADGSERRRFSFNRGVHLPFTPPASHVEVVPEHEFTYNWPPDEYLTTTPIRSGTLMEFTDN